MQNVMSMIRFFSFFFVLFHIVLWNEKYRLTLNTEQRAFAKVLPLYSIFYMLYAFSTSFTSVPRPLSSDSRTMSLLHSCTCTVYTHSHQHEHYTIKCVMHSTRTTRFVETVICAHYDFNANLISKMRIDEFQNVFHDWVKFSGKITTSTHQIHFHR